MPEPSTRLKGSDPFQRVALLAAVFCLLLAAPAAAVPPQPIPEGPAAGSLSVFSGHPAAQHPVAVPDPPRHPFMAPNGRSNLHVDGYQSDVHQGPGPLGKGMERRSTFLEGVCASVTFDSRGRIETVCVGVEGPKLLLLDPRTLDTLAAMPLPPRQPGGGNLFTDFAGGGYFYLDNRDRAVIPTTLRHVYVVGQTGSGFTIERDYDLSTVVLPGDKIISALPDWSGRLWFASTNGVVGTVDPKTGAVRSRPLGEKIANSFAVEDTGAVYIVSDAALYRLTAGAGGVPVTVWRKPYANSGVQKPGQSSAGSGTTPTLMSAGLVAITDNADPMNVVVYRTARKLHGKKRKVCEQPVFDKGASATENSLLTAGRSIIVENNYGYQDPFGPNSGDVTQPGFARVDIRPGAKGCTKVWTNHEVRAPTVVPKLSTKTGLIYTYARPKDPSGSEGYYWTAIDFRTGRTVWQRYAGSGLPYNNNYSGLALGPGGSAYLGTAGGIVTMRDGG